MLSSLPTKMLISPSPMGADLAPFVRSNDLGSLGKCPTHTHARACALTHTLTEAGKPLRTGQGHCVRGWTPGSVWSLGLHLVAYGPMALKPWHLCFPTTCGSQRWPAGSRSHALAFLESGTADDQSVRLPFLDEKTKAQGVKKFARDVGMRPALFCFVWNSKVQQDWLGQKLNFKT